MVRVPAGTFLMGSLSGHSDERPVHEVKLSEGFWMMKTPVTQALWKKYAKNNLSNFSGSDDAPVEQVSWFEAVWFANYLSEEENLEKCYEIVGTSSTPGNGNFRCFEVKWLGKEKTGYRLPTEAEWEYACRAGSQEDRYGDLNNIAWYNGNSGSRTHKVGEKAPNNFGLYDMLGNVWEWCWDWKNSYRSGSVMDPTGPTDGGHRVHRGGSWNDRSSSTRAASRGSYLPDSRGYDLGFRLVRRDVP